MVVRIVIKEYLYIIGLLGFCLSSLWFSMQKTSLIQGSLGAFISLQCFKSFSVCILISIGQTCEELLEDFLF